MRISKRISAAVLASLLLFSGCGSKKITDPKKFKADHGVYITGNGAYDANGKVVLRSVSEADDGWKQLNFFVDADMAIDDFYIVPLKAGVAVDDIVIYDGSVDAILQSQFSKVIVPVTFEDGDKLGKSYGFQIAEKAGREGKVILAEDTATKILYFVKNGKTQNPNLLDNSEHLLNPCKNYVLSLWVNFEWSGTNYDNLIYIGINAEQDATA